MNAQAGIPVESSQGGTQESREQEFQYRLDFYWQAIALYASALLLYAFFKGSITEGTITIQLRDPVVMALGVVVLGSAAFSVVNWYMRRSVVVGENFIRFRNRFRTRTFDRREILSLSFRKRKIANVGGAHQMVKIRLANRRRLLRLRPSLYNNDLELVQMLIALKRRIAERREA
jgi:hypothetical protein